MIIVWRHLQNLLDFILEYYFNYIKYFSLANFTLNKLLITYLYNILILCDFHNYLKLRCIKINIKINL